MSSKYAKFIFFAVVFLLILVFAAGSIYAEVNENTVLKKRKALESELSVLEDQIDAYRSLIKVKQKDAVTFQRDIAILNAKINQSLLEIKARKIAISKLDDNISEHSELINNYNSKIDSQKTSLSAFIRRINELDDTSLIELVLKYDNLSDFFVELDNYDTIQGAMQKTLVVIKDTRNATEKEKDELQKKRGEQLELKSIQELEKKRIEDNEKEKKSLLAVTKGEEKKYQQVLSERQKRAAQIRTQLFMLRGSPAIPFEKAVKYANVAYKATGIRPALLLGILTEESNLGANVGGGNWTEDLSHPKCASQREAFTVITSELGLDPDEMPVSKKAWYGYCGGAMGPAQFMPTTWQLYKKYVARITGNNPPNPWNPLDAFVASALLLKDNGGSYGDYNAEWRAAMRYLAGSNWNNPSYRFYGDDVMSFAKKYQDEIDILEEN